MKFIRILLPIIAVAFLFFNTDGLAQTNTWTGGGGSTLWDDEENWDLGVIPTAGHDVIIGDSGDKVDIKDGYSAVAKSLSNAGLLTIKDLCYLTIDGSEENGLENSGRVDVLGSLDISNTLSNGINNIEDSAVINNTGTIIIGTDIGGAGILNEGLFYNLVGASLEIDDCLNYGISNIACPSVFSNEGNIEIGSNVTMQGINNECEFISYSNSSGTATIYIEDNGLVESYNQSGYLHGEGIISAAGGLKQNGKITPGFSTGVITINGDFLHTSSSVDSFEIKGIAGPGMNMGHDQINVDGDLTMDGELFIENISFDPNPVDTWTLLTYTGAISGEYSSLSLPAPGFEGWAIDYGRTSPGSVILRKCGQLDWVGGVGIWQDNSNWSPAYVPCECDTVIVNNTTDSVTISATFTASAASVFSKGYFKIESTASLTIDGSSTHGFHKDHGKLINSGTLSIENTASNGLYNEYGKIVNNGSILINNTTGDGIYLVDYFTLYIDDLTFLNEGSITMSSSIGNNGIENIHGGFSNQSNGTIEINNTASDGILNSDEAYFNNSGNIVLNQGIGNIGILNSNGAVFQNNGGTISMSDIVLDGISNASSPTANSYFRNKSGGTITLDNITSNGISNSYYNSTFENFSGCIITISNSLLGIGNIVGADFSNEGTITMITGLESGINNSGFFQNGNMGTITIDNTTTNGIRNYRHGPGLSAPCGYFTNEGSITLADNLGVGIDAGDCSFINSVGGIINISNTSLDALGVSGAMTNEGSITTQ